jgi:hypothetical protein
MRSDAALNAVAAYARNGDAGALRALSSRYPGLDAKLLEEYPRGAMPFRAWADRVARNAAVVDSASGEGAPPEFIDELTEALRRLTPAEREALEQALSRSTG